MEQLLNKIRHDLDFRDINVYNFKLPYHIDDLHQIVGIKKVNDAIQFIHVDGGKKKIRDVSDYQKIIVEDVHKWFKKELQTYGH